MNETPEHPDVTDANDAGLPPEAEKSLDVEQVPQEGETPPTVFSYTLVMAEVIFLTELGPQSKRVQFLSKSNTECFPHARLLQLQQLAAEGVVQEIKQLSNGAFKKIEVEAVYILNLLDLGWMTEEQFLGDSSRLTPLEVVSPVAQDETAAPLDGPVVEIGDNVVPLRP